MFTNVIMNLSRQERESTLMKVQKIRLNRRSSYFFRQTRNALNVEHDGYLQRA